MIVDVIVDVIVAERFVVVVDAMKEEVFVEGQKGMAKCGVFVLDFVVV